MADMTDQEAKWQAEDDARTLARAAAIEADGIRLTQAKKAAVEMAEEKTREAEAMRRLAGLQPEAGNGLTFGRSVGRRPRSR